MNSTLVVVLLVVVFACSQALDTDQKQTNEVQETFFYFAYGTMMLTKIIHKNSPSAKPVTIAKLTGYRLDFVTYLRRWHGCHLTIVPEKSAEIWGVVWQVKTSEVSNLDRYELVPEGMYFAKNVTVRTVDGKDLVCRTYQQTVLPDTYVSPSELPPERQPSPAYLNTVINGAKEYNVPSYYVDFLRSFRDNGYQGEASGN